VANFKEGELLLGLKLSVRIGTLHEIFESNDLMRVALLCSGSKHDHNIIVYKCRRTAMVTMVRFSNKSMATNKIKLVVRYMILALEF